MSHANGLRLATIAALSCAALILLAPSAHTQTPRGLNANFRISNGMSGGNNPSELRSPGVWTSVAPLLVRLQNLVSYTQRQQSACQFTGSLPHLAAAVSTPLAIFFRSQHYRIRCLFALLFCYIK